MTHRYLDRYTQFSEKRLVFQILPENAPEKTPEIMDKKPPEVPRAEFEKLHSDVTTLLSAENAKEELKGDIQRRLDSFKNTFSLQQLEAMKKIFDAKKENLKANYQILREELEREYAERLEQAKQQIQETGDVVMQSIEQSGMPEWLRSALAVLQDNPVTRFVQKGYYFLMANLDKVVPESFKNFLPFLQAQIDGAKEMLLKLGARDGIVEAVEAQKKQGRLFEIEWTDFDIAWETRWRPAYEEALKANPKMSSKDFVKREMLTYLSTFLVIHQSTLIVDLGDLVVKSVGTTSTSPSRVGEGETLSPELPAGLERGKTEELKKDTDSIQLTIEGISYTIAHHGVKIGDQSYRFGVQSGDITTVKVEFMPVKEGTLKDSIITFTGPSTSADPSPTKIQWKLSEIGSADAVTKSAGDAFKISITRVRPGESS